MIDEADRDGDGEIVRDLRRGLGCEGRGQQGDSCGEGDLAHGGFLSVLHSAATVGRAAPPV
jgi:hypothetical protein